MEKGDLPPATTEERLKQIKSLYRDIRTNLQTATELVKHLTTEECEGELSEVNYLMKLNYQVKNMTEKNEKKYNTVSGKAEIKAENKKKKENEIKRRKEVSKFKPKGVSRGIMTEEVMVVSGKADEDETGKSGIEDFFLKKMQKFGYKTNQVIQKGGPKLALVDYENFKILFDDDFSFFEFVKDKNYINFQKTGKLSMLRFKEIKDKVIEEGIDEILEAHKEMLRLLKFRNRNEELKNKIFNNFSNFKDFRKNLKTIYTRILAETILFGVRVPVTGHSKYTQTAGTVQTEEITKVATFNVEEFKSMKKDYKMLKAFYDANFVKEKDKGSARKVTEKSKMKVKFDGLTPLPSIFKETAMENLKCIFKDTGGNVLIGAMNGTTGGYKDGEILSTNHSGSILNFFKIFFRSWID